MINVLFAAKPARWAEYEPPLRAAFAAAGLNVNLTTEATNPRDVDYIVYAPNGTLDDFRPFTGCKAVLGLWAGVEDIVGNKSLTQPLARMVDFGLTEGMVEWCIGHLMRHHLGMDAHIHGQDGVWRAGVIPPLARERIVTVLGLGHLGQAVARAAAALNFRVRGWSRRPAALAGIGCFSGPAGLEEALSGAGAVILLLPATPQTERVLNRDRLDLLARGAFVINPGRGMLIDDDALLAALNGGRVAHATLDVFRQEPLPVDHPFWSHSKVTVTPHIASETRPASAAEVIAENVRRGEAGLPLLHLVDRAAGY